MPSLDFLKLFVVTGLALGGVYALSGVGIVVLYRATGVLNLAFGAVGALGAFISWELVNNTDTPDWIAYLVCIIVATGVTFLYGVVFGPLLAARDPLVKAIGTLGLALILLGMMSWKWGQIAGLSLTAPHDEGELHAATRVRRRELDADHRASRSASRSLRGRRRSCA